MSEIRNLTRNGETFYPLTCTDAVVDRDGNPVEIINDIFDVSEYNATGTPPVLAKYASLDLALAAIPVTKRKGGMSMRYVQSSDNKYVQYRCMAQNFTTDITKWAIDDNGVYVENPEFVYVKTDSDDKILWAIKADGDIYFGAGVPTQVKDYIQSKISELSLDEYEDIVAFLGNLIEGDSLATLLNAKVDKVTGKGLSTNDFTNSEKEVVDCSSVVEDGKWMEVETDSEDKILGGRLLDGTKVENMPIKTPLKGISYIDDTEWLDVELDEDGKILRGLRKDGTQYEAQIPQKTKRYIDETKKEILNIVNNNFPLDTIFPEILPNYIMPSATDVMRKYINGAYAKERLTPIYNFWDSSVRPLQHDGTLKIINDKAYVVCTYNPDRTDSITDACKVMLYELNLNDTTELNSYIVAKKDDSWDNITMDSGAGAPNMILVDDILHIIFVAFANDDLCVIHTTFDTTNKIFGGYSQITLTKGNISGIITNNLLNSMFGYEEGISLQMTCSIGVNGNDYYAGFIHGEGKGTAFIMKSSDLVNWTFVTTMDFGVGSHAELACWCKNGILYACKRIPPSTGTSIIDNAQLSVLAKYSLTSNKWVTATAIKNCCSKMTFFEFDGNIYLITCGTTRGNSQIIKIDETSLINSKVIMEVDSWNLCYPSVCVYEDEVYIVATADWGGTSMPLSVLEMNHYTDDQIREKMINIM